MSTATATITIQDEVLSLLVSSPSPEEIVDFRASDVAQNRLRYLLDALRTIGLTEAEQAELDEISQTNHFVTLLKGKAHQILKAG